MYCKCIYKCVHAATRCVCTVCIRDTKRAPHEHAPARGDHRTSYFSSVQPCICLCVCLNTSKTDCRSCSPPLCSLCSLKPQRSKRKRDLQVHRRWNDCDAMASSARVGFKWLKNSRAVILYFLFFSIHWLICLWQTNHTNASSTTWGASEALDCFSFQLLLIKRLTVEENNLHRTMGDIYSSVFLHTMNQAVRRWNRMVLNTVCLWGRIRCAISFLQLQKSHITFTSFNSTPKCQFRWFPFAYP